MAGVKANAKLELLHVAGVFYKCVARPATARKRYGFNLLLWN